VTELVYWMEEFGGGGGNRTRVRKC